MHGHLNVKFNQKGVAGNDDYTNITFFVPYLFLNLMHLLLIMAVAMMRGSQQRLLIINKCSLSCFL